MKFTNGAAMVAALLLGACSTNPPLNFSPSGITISDAKQDASLVTTSVTLARPEEAIGKVELAGSETEVATLWKSALDDALGRTAVFKDDSLRRVNLAVKVMKLDLPSAGIVMVTQTIARYELIDRKTGKAIFSTDVTSAGRVPGDYAFYGVVRMRESASRSVQANISEFLEQLKKAKLPLLEVASSPAASTEK